MHVCLCLKGEGLVRHTSGITHERAFTHEDNLDGFAFHLEPTLNPLQTQTHTCILLIMMVLMSIRVLVTKASGVQGGPIQA